MARSVSRRPWPPVLLSPYLEPERQSDIHQPLAAGIRRRAFVTRARRDFTERRRIREIHRRVRRRQVVPLERVLEIETERSRRAFLHPPLLRRGKLRIDEALPVESVPPDVADRISVRIRKVVH